MVPASDKVNVVFSYRLIFNNFMATSAPIQLLAVVARQSALTLKGILSALPGISLVGAVTQESDAAEILRDTQIDVVLVDMGSHEVNGIGLIRQVRQSHPNLRVVVATASTSPEHIFAAMDAGADGYVLHGNRQGLEVAIRSVKLGPVWLDPGIATQVLDVMTTTTPLPNARVLPTGLFRIPLLPEEKDLLQDVAHSNCVDGVCMVDPSFVARLRQFAQVQA